MVSKSLDQLVCKIGDQPRIPLGQRLYVLQVPLLHVVPSPEHSPQSVDVRGEPVKLTALSHPARIASSGGGSHGRILQRDSSPRVPIRSLESLREGRVAETAEQALCP